MARSTRIENVQCDECSHVFEVIWYDNGSVFADGMIPWDSDEYGYSFDITHGDECEAMLMVEHDRGF